MPLFLYGEVATWEIVILENVHLGNCTFGKNCHLGKYPWEVAAWEKAFGKVPNIDLGRSKTSGNKDQTDQRYLRIRLNIT